MTSTIKRLFAPSHRLPKPARNVPREPQPRAARPVDAKGTALSVRYVVARFADLVRPSGPLVVDEVPRDEAHVVEPLEEGGPRKAAPAAGVKPATLAATHASQITRSKRKINGACASVLIMLPSAEALLSSCLAFTLRRSTWSAFRFDVL